MSFLYDAAKSDTPLTEDAIASNPEIAKQLQAHPNSVSITGFAQQVNKNSYID